MGDISSGKACLAATNIAATTITATATNIEAAIITGTAANIAAANTNYNLF